jgi:ribosomal protein S18 acetylase RimI-like enzyme
MNAPALRWFAHGCADYDAAVELRREVLRRPLGLDFTAEQLAAEASQLHLGAWSGGVLLGCLTLIVEDGAARMRQVAVAPRARDQGIGRLLVAECESEALRRGAASMTLHARQTAVGFYERLGYASRGGSFVEVGVEHRLMAKTLTFAPIR